MAQTPLHVIALRPGACDLWPDVRTTAALGRARAGRESP